VIFLRQNRQDPAAFEPLYFCGQSGGQVGNGTALLCAVGNACTAKIPAAASASQSERVIFFMVILLEFVGTAAPQ
jgi:hypothetical protein